MDQILENLKSPSWWFTGVFFILVGILLTKVFTKWLPYIWIYVAQRVPKLTRRFQRWKELKVLKRVKRYRQHQTEVMWLISKFWSLMTVFTIYTVFIMVSFSLSTEVADKSNEIKKLLPLVLPLYAFQVLIMWEQVVLKRVRKAHIAWQKRIKNKDAVSGDA
ncbi:hypothetical protein KFE26_23205 [Shewanella sp. M16]|uniref:hypothetical protein n=1 Tax=Shewanella sp. M16 TaxID=2830837 RepID=UPI001BB00578|nr:hypothetical protein [Shewanella sp. M16]MBS0045158.1 hypothetical protein [Shewanella sp. M16]